MRILLLNQCFHPDHVATAQHLTDLALTLRSDDHEVTVLASCRGYDNPAILFPCRENWRGIDIHRIWTPGLGKKSMLHRLGDAAMFWLNALRMAMMMPRHDVVVSLTSPPLISVVGAVAAIWQRHARSIIWLMDLNPDQAIANGVLRKNSVTERFLSAALGWSFQKAAQIIVLDRFMAERLRQKQVGDDRLKIVPPWSHDSHVRYDLEGREAFRKQHGLYGKFVVMYSGNHSPCHPLDTVLAVAEQLRENPKVHFLFVGGGSEYQKVQEFAVQKTLPNITCLPYQPLDMLSSSLSAADLHLVVMGDAYIGIVHPCKIYNILMLGVPFLFVGPNPSHVSDIARSISSPSYARLAGHGEIAQVRAHIEEACQTGPLPPSEKLRSLAKNYSHKHLCARLVQIVTTS